MGRLIRRRIDEGTGDATIGRRTDCCGKARSPRHARCVSARRLSRAEPATGPRCKRLVDVPAVLDNDLIMVARRPALLTAALGFIRLPLEHGLRYSRR